MGHYIDNQEFEYLVSAYIFNRTPEIENKLILNLEKLIDNIFVSFNFNLELDDAKQDCYLLIFRVLANFNPSQGSAFNYFTTVIVNNLRLIYTKNKVYNQKLEKYIKSKYADKDLLEG